MRRIPLSRRSHVTRLRFSRQRGGRARERARAGLRDGLEIGPHVAGRLLHDYGPWRRRRAAIALRRTVDPSSKREGHRSHDWGAAVADLGASLLIWAPVRGFGGKRQPSNPARTTRLSTGANLNSSALHSVGIGASPWTRANCCCTTSFSESVPRCTQIV